MKKMKTMTEGVIWKEILFFAIPLILGNLFQQLYNTVDSIIVGNYVGSNALAAVGSSGAIINLLIGFCIGASTGAGVVISQFYGAKNTEGVRKAVHTTMAIALVAGVLLTVIGITVTPSMLRLMGTPDKVFEQSVIYLQVYFGGSLFSVVYNMSAGILNAVGNSRRSLVYLMIAAISNIFLDLIMVVGLKLGIVGAALATDISQLISCIFIWGFLIRSEDVYKLKIKEIRCYDHLLSKIIRIGIPTGIQNIVISLSNLIVQASVNSFGATVMAGFAAYIKIDGFNILPVLSISMAATTFAGQNIGAGKADRVRKGMYISTAMGAGYSVITGIVLLIFAPQVIGVFTTNHKVVEYGVYIMKYFCPFYWMLGILHVLGGTIRGTGKTMQAMIVFLVSLCGFRVMWIAGTMAWAKSLGHVMMCYPTSWLLGMLLMLLYVWKGNWMVLRKADRVRKGMYISTAMGAGYSVITGIVLLIFAPQVIGVFTTNHKVVEYGVYIMKYFCPFYWMLGILHVLGGTIRGTGKTMQAMIVFLVSLCGFRVMWIAGTMAWAKSLGHVMMCYPTSWLLGMLLMLLYVWKGNWMVLRTEKI